ncbi:terminase small subunit [Kroppenstedtia sanguinis]|uniref:Terminase small subunit n=1 Tax=Kroppenstedtia sanguinis TaxID=1380684 RepID=A0ABW4C607_9BACL
MPKLTPKQKAFCDYYIETGNATEAAIKAGYSKKTAKQTGAENLSKPYLKAYIEQHMEKATAKRIMDAEEALKILTNIARGEAVEEVITQSGKKVLKRADINQQQKAIDSLMKRYNVIATLEKTQAEAEFLREKTKMIRGATKDTSIMEALIDVVNSDD